MQKAEAYRLLLVEDDSNFGKVLSNYLRLHGHSVELTRNGREGLETWTAGSFDLALLDVMMPEIDGFTLARKIREKDERFPFLFLTAKGLKEDVLEGYSAGADDYLVKPFDSEVLLMKIQSVMNRVTMDMPVEAEYRFGKFTYRPELRVLSLREREWMLSPKEGDLLTMLCQHKNGLLKRSLALQKIWNEDSYFTGRSMDVYIAKLRKYLKEDKAVQIVNVHSEGFRLIDEFSA
jgi:two-component system OmpR family response regulator